MTRNGKPQSDRYNGHEAHCCKCRQRCAELEAAIRRYLQSDTCDEHPADELAALVDLQPRKQQAVRP